MKIGTEVFIYPFKTEYGGLMGMVVGSVVGGIRSTDTKDVTEWAKGTAWGYIGGATLGIFTGSIRWYAENRSGTRVSANYNTIQRVGPTPEYYWFIGSNKKLMTTKLNLSSSYHFGNSRNRNPYNNARDCVKSLNLLI